MTREEWLQELRELDLDELRSTYARFCTLERGLEIYGMTAEMYESNGADLSSHIDVIEAEFRRRGLEPPQ